MSATKVAPPKNLIVMLSVSETSLIFGSSQKIPAIRHCERAKRAWQSTMCEARIMGILCHLIASALPRNDNSQILLKSPTKTQTIPNKKRAQASIAHAAPLWILSY